MGCRSGRRSTTGDVCMDLWNGTLAEFVRLANADGIAGAMTGQFVTLHGTTPGPSEVQSWRASLAALATSLQDLSRTDVAVGVRDRTDAPGPYGVARAQSAISLTPPAVCTEYHLPYSRARIDVMLFGRDATSRRRALVVELKQWSDVSLANDDSANVVVGGIEHAHPSRQALDYAEWLADYHSAFTAGSVASTACAYLHNMPPPGVDILRESRFSDLLHSAPAFGAREAVAFRTHAESVVGHGGGREILADVTGGTFSVGRRVLDALDAVLHDDLRWRLLDAQRVAFEAVLGAVRTAQRKQRSSVILIRGAPGTGKTVIAVQLLADVARLGLKAAHSTGGKAFTTALRSKFKGADKLFVWNMALRKAPPQGLDLLLVDEAHRIRETSDTRFTPAIERGRRSQVDELIDAAKVTVFLLDENQFVRPDEIGQSALIEETARRRKLPLKTYDLAAQYRCGGCEEYVAWIDRLLGFSTGAPTASWGDRYRIDIADSTADLDRLLDESRGHGERARLLGGFCWKWSNPLENGSLVNDVVIGDWQRPWNAKASDSKSYRPDQHPYTLWAETDAGIGQVGCIYSAQGFEFDRVGVIWGHDLVWRGGEWVSVKAASHDKPVRSSPQMLRLVRNAYRVLLTRGIRETRVLILDDETREHVRSELARLTEVSPPTIR